MATELRLTRTILERLECSFARLEAKLDWLLSIMTTTRTMEQHTSQCPPQPPQTLPAIQQFSTPNPTTCPSQSLEYQPYTTSAAFQGTPLSDVERLLDDPVLIGILKDKKMFISLISVQLNATDRFCLKAWKKFFLKN